jgi:hypothetical protein
MGEAVFWLKPLYQLGFVRFFNFYFWTFGLLKQHHGLAKARYLGLERNKTRAQLIAMSRFWFGLGWFLRGD